MGDGARRRPMRHRCILQEGLLSEGAASPGRVILTGEDPRPSWPSPHEHALVRLPYVEYGRDARSKPTSRPT